jgi:hypothetical protein
MDPTLETSKTSNTSGIPDAGRKPDATVSAAFSAAVEFLCTIALLVFAFVILNTVGDALNLAANSLSLDLPHLVTWVILIVGYGLQVFAAVWFVGIAVSFWNDFVGQNKDIHKV